MPDSTRKSIRLIAKAESWPHNITTSQWGDLWKRKFITDERFDATLASLSSYLYSVENADGFDELNLQLFKIVKERKKL